MNDDRITAYALNELQGAEREQFESDLAGDPRLQRELLAACEITDALGEVAEESRDGLEPRARERLLREIAANQAAFRTRRKIVRFAIPVSLSAAASIAVLLSVSGGTATPKPAIAAVGQSEKRDTTAKVFVRSDSTTASGTAGVEDRLTNVPVLQKRVMPWDAKVLGADLGRPQRDVPSASPGLE